MLLACRSAWRGLWRLAQLGRKIDKHASPSAISTAHFSLVFDGALSQCRGGVRERRAPCRGRALRLPWVRQCRPSVRHRVDLSLDPSAGRTVKPGAEDVRALCPGGSHHGQGAAGATVLQGRSAGANPAGSTSPDRRLLSSGSLLSPVPRAAGRPPHTRCLRVHRR